jgi:hypothetical protein
VNWFASDSAYAADSIAAVSNWTVFSVVLLSAFFFCTTACLAQSDSKAEATLQSLKESLERNVAPETSCRKDLLPDQLSSEPDRWVAELKTCLGAFGISLRTSAELKRQLDELEKKIRTAASKLPPCGKGASVSSAASADQAVLDRADLLIAQLDGCVEARLPPDSRSPPEGSKPPPRGAAAPKGAAIASGKPDPDIKNPVDSGFAFAGGGSGAMVAIAVQRDGIPGPGRRVSAAQCSAALDWLMKQQDRYFPRLWAFAGDSLRLCQRTARGDEVIDPPEPNTEAHAVVLR